MILNSTNARTLERLYKTAYIEQWIGRQFEVGVESVRVGPSREDALRIHKYLPRVAGETVKCSDCNEPITATERMTAAQVAAYGRKRYGLDLCADCFKKRKASQDEAERADGTAPDDAAEPAAEAPEEQLVDQPETPAEEQEGPADE